MECARTLKSVLLIGVDHESQDFYQKQLVTLGIHCDTVSCVREGLKKLNHTHCAVLVDIALPDTSGIQVAHRIRERFDFLANIPIIAVSKNHQPAIEKTCRRARINCFISKPIKPDTFVETLRQYVCF